MDKLDNLGLGLFGESEENFGFLVKDTCQNGIVKIGYYGEPYINRYWGDPQFVARIHRNDEKKSLDFDGLDIHVIGNSVWEFEISGMDFQPKNADRLERRVIARKVKDGNGMAVVNLLNADLLPSFLEGDRVKAQMIGFAEFIRYYENEEQYAADMDQGDDEDGRPMLLADGTVFPSGIFLNHSPDSEMKDEDPYSDNICLIRGTVKSISAGEVKLGEKKTLYPYYNVTIGTEFGDLDIVHSPEQIDAEAKERLKVGAIALGGFYLSGDVAIDEYEKGLVKDEEHGLALVRYTIIKGDAERMRSVLNDDSVYVSEYSDGATFKGADDIIERFKYVRSADPERKIYGYYATVTESDGHLPYGVGKRCVVLSYDEPRDYSAILFVDADENGGIAKILVSIDPRYHFRIDEEPERVNVLEDIEPPLSVSDPILCRARFHHFIDRETENEDVLEMKTHYEYFEEQADGVIGLVDGLGGTEQSKALSNAFGHVFAKAMTYDHLYRHPEKEIDIELLSTLDGALDDRFEIKLEGFDKKLQRAYKYGKQFYKDFETFSRFDPEEDLKEILFEALMTVQQIAVIYSRKKMI